MVFPMNSTMKNEIDQYRTKHKKSMILWKKAKKQFPAGVSHNIRDFHMTHFDLSPPFIKKSYDSKLVDVDDNIYTDFWITHGAAILGHAHPAVMKAIENQLPNGNHFGMVNEVALDLADRIIEATPSIQELRFCTTGTEATMYASRLARAFTGKKKIAKVIGGWHGGNDTLFYYVKEVKHGVESKGIRNQSEAGILSFDYNDTEGAIRIIRENKGDLAAVVMEPVLGAGGAIPPNEGFLEAIREETEKNDILLIYDEIITGFRLSYRSAQGYFGITPDITTMGKIVGGGTPIGIIGGRKDILEQANLQKGGEVWIGGGTFSGNPVSMAAGIATLDTLKSGGEKLYSDLNSMGEKLRSKIREIIEQHNLPAFVTGVGSMVSIHWFKEKQEKIENSTAIEVYLDKEKVANYMLLMLNREILTRGGLGYLSIKHTDLDVEKALKAVNEASKIIANDI
ncbi:MAG: aspartate aminotransferase family protein [Candidatus Heimdallarchaeota archaeon]